MEWTDASDNNDMSLVKKNGYRLQILPQNPGKI